MKQFVCFILAICLTASLAACGGTPSVNLPGNASVGNTSAHSTSGTSVDHSGSAMSSSTPTGPEESDLPPAASSEDHTNTDEAEPDSSQQNVQGAEEQSPVSQGSTSQAQQEGPSQTTASSAQVQPPEGASYSQAPQETAKKILIAYFTWADNTTVEDPSSVDPTIDVPSSASIIAPGDTARIAGWIQQEVGGDLHSIITRDPYSSDYDECLDRAIEEHDNGIRPALSSSVRNIDDYDIIFLGYPNWWYSCPMAILTFIEQNDLSGKTIVPYCTHGTGGLASSLRDIKAALPSDCTVLKEYDVSRSGVRSAQPAVQRWLSGLDL